MDISQKRKWCILIFFKKKQKNTCITGVDKTISDIRVRQQKQMEKNKNTLPLPFSENELKSAFEKLRLEEAQKMILEQETEKDRLEKKPFRILMYLSPILVFGAMQSIFWIFHGFLDKIIHAEEAHKAMLQIGSIQAGFLTTALALIVQSRDNRTISDLKRKTMWLIGEASLVWGTVFYSLAVILAFYHLLNPPGNEIGFSFEQSFLMCGMFYFAMLILSLKLSLKYF